MEEPGKEKKAWRLAAGKGNKKSKVQEKRISVFEVS